MLWVATYMHAMGGTIWCISTRNVCRERYELAQNTHDRQKNPNQNTKRRKRHMIHKTPAKTTARRHSLPSAAVTNTQDVAKKTSSSRDWKYQHMVDDKRLFFHLQLPLLRLQPALKRLLLLQRLLLLPVLHLLLL